MHTVRPWKFSSTEKTSASFCGIPLTLYPHLRATLTAVSTASAPVFMGRDHVEAEQLGGILCKAREHIVVESATAQSQPRGLLSEGLDKLGVAVTLVDGAVGGEEVEVVLALGVPDAATTCS